MRNVTDAAVSDVDWMPKSADHFQSLSKTYVRSVCPFFSASSLMRPQTVSV